MSDYDQAEENAALRAWANGRDFPRDAYDDERQLVQAAERLLNGGIVGLDEFNTLLEAMGFEMTMDGGLLRSRPKRGRPQLGQAGPQPAPPPRTRPL